MSKNTSAAVTGNQEGNKALPKGRLMYVGPSLLSPVPLSFRSVFTDGIPKFALDLAGKDPDLAACFVPLKEAGAILRELEKALPAGEASRCFVRVQQRYQRSK